MGYVDPTPQGGGDTAYLNDGTWIEMWDYDAPPYSSQRLATATADEDGFFEFFSVDNEDLNESGGQDIFFRVYSSSDDALVLASLPDVEYQWDSDTTWDISGGVHCDTIAVAADSAGPFFLLDRVQKSYDGWNAIAGDNAIEDVAVILLNTTCTTGYRYSLDLIYVNDSTNSALDMWSLEFSEWVLHHEYGHRISRNTEFFDPSPGATHWLGGTYGDSVAASEGWSQFWAGYVQDSSMLVTYWNNFNDHDWLDLENGVFSDSGVLYGSANAMGLCNEVAVAGILWDIYDSEDDDCSSVANYGSLSLPHTGDGVGDSLSDGIGTIVDVLTNRFMYNHTDTSHHADNMDEFWVQWFNPHDKSLYNQEAADIYYEHGDSTRGSGCCYGITGNIDADSDEWIDVNDIIYLVAYMFNGGPAPTCMDECDVNGFSGVADITDLVYIVTYMFSGGPSPVPCQ